MSGMAHSGSAVVPTEQKVACGDCAFFVRDGRCDFLRSPSGQDRARPFEHAPFWVWSDCYSDKEQVRAGVVTLCPTFAAKATGEQS